MAKDAKSQTQKIVNMIIGGDKYRLFQDQFGNPSVICSEQPLIGFSLNSRKFRQSISHIAWRELDFTISPTSIDTILEALAGFCSLTEEKFELYNRVAFSDDVVYYDIGDNEHVVVITGTGYSVEKSAPVVFRRYTHQRKQVLPENGGNLEDILQFFNLKNERQKILLLTYLPVCLIANINHPLLLIHGSQGSGKSTALTLIRSMIDPSEIPLLSPSKQLEEFIRQASHNYCFFLDNISYISSDTSDALCRLVTGMSFAKRELYTDDEDILYSFKRITGFNGVAQFANKPDLLDRSLILQFERITGIHRKKESEIQADFELNKAKLLGALFSVVSHLLNTRGQLEIEILPRMADYYEFAASAADCLGYGIDAFARAFQENVEDQHQEAINASIVATLILEFMSRHEKWEGSGSDLFTQLKEKATDQGFNSGFPKDANWLWRRIQEVKPELEAVGVVAEKDDSVRPRKITLTRLTNYRQPVSNSASESIFPSENPQAMSIDEDGIHSIKDETEVQNVK